MFAHLPYYTSAETVLKQNGYKVDGDSQGFTISNGFKEENTTTVSVGPFSAPFLNSWIQDSGIDGVSGFPINFAVGVPAQRALLSGFSAKMKDLCVGLGLTAAQGDAMAVEKFLSKEITTEGTTGIYRYEKATTLKMLEFVDMSGDGLSIRFTNEDNEPFYFKIHMVQRNKPLAAVPKIWMDKIQEHGLSWSFVDAHLYVSNTVGASFGLPPCPAHLQMPALNLSFDNWNAGRSEKKDEKRTFREERKREQAPDASADEEADYSEVETLLEQFIDGPSKATHDSLINSRACKELYTNENRKPEYKMGSNKYSQVSQIRDMMVGARKAKSWDEYAEAVVEIANPDTVVGRCIILKRLAGSLRTHKGLVYCLENNN